MPSVSHTDQSNENIFSAERPFRFRRWNAAWVACVVFCLLGWPGWSEAADQAKARYEKALQLARGGRHQAALPILKQLTEEFPKERSYLYDYMTVLGWAGEDEAVLSLRSRVDLEAAPPYLLETLGRAARNLKDYPAAIQYYQMANQRAPERVDGGIGLARSHAESGNAREAIEILKRLDETHPQRIDILEALADVHRLDKNNLEALAVYHRILRIDPAHRESRRRRILIAADLGAPHLAASMARENPGLLTDDELEAILTDQAAQSIRWGGLGDASSPEETDTGIRLLQEQVARLKEQGRQDSAASQRVRLDLLSALRDRERMAEVIGLYEELVAERREIPDYISLAAAEAYLHEGNPKKAREIDLQVLDRTPGHFDAAISLFFLNFDAGEVESAMRLIETLAAEQQEPAQKLRAETLVIKGYAWSGRLAEAERRLAPLVERAPNNASLHADLGFVYLWRGWPRLAKEEFQLSRMIEPHLLDPQIGEVAAERDLFEFREAEEGILGLEARHPGNRQVRRLRRGWEIQMMRELRVAFSGRANSGVEEGTRDLALDVTLYSRPIADRFRLFDHAHYSRSEFPEGSALYRRLGAGIEYRARDVKIEGELSTGAEPDTEIGLSLCTLWMPDDFWTWGVAFDTYSNDVPLRGRLNENLQGWSIGLTAGYRFNESRSIGAGLQLLGFSDDNRRTAYSLVGFQRLINRSTYKLDGRLGFYGSANTLEGASYYNPSSDLSAEIGLTNEWLIFRRGARSFLHRLELTLGSYFESGFGAKWVWGIRYEHEWNLTDRLYLLYGIGRFRPVYDGVSETSVRYDVTLDWRF